MFKLQSAIEKFFLSAIVIVVAIVVSYFLYKSFYSIVSHASIKSYLTQASFDNIYGNKTSIFVLLKNETNVGSNVIINEMITFYNGTSKTYKIPFALQMAYASGGGFLYDFATTNFPAISNNSQPIKISNVFIISGNHIIESENNSITYSSYYYTKSSLENVPLYYLNMSATPLGAGNLTPGNGYYYAGSKLAISEKPNIGYAFSGWSGFGNGNYTGPNQTAIIEMNSNITEYAKYVKLVKMYVNATYNGIPVYVNSALNTTTNGTIYLIPGVKYTLSLPMYVSLNSGTRYAFESMSDDCGISISPNSNSTTFVPSYSNYNCKFMANYVEQYSLLINFNSSEGSVTPSSGWYKKGSNIEITATQNNGYIFVKAIGSGTISYTGNNTQFYVTMDSPITENIIFEPIVYVYVYSSAQSVPYSFKSNYGVFYNGTTNSNFVAIGGSILTLENHLKQINWGERSVINMTSYDCQASTSSINLPSIGGSTCVIYLTPPTTQYLFIMNEFLNGGSESNNFTYGTVYLNGNPMTSNQVWINAGTDVTFYATNDKAGYAFQGFSGGDGVLDGVAYSGVSGTDSSPGIPVGDNQQYSYLSPPPQRHYSSGYNLTNSNFPGALGADEYSSTFDYSAVQYIPIHIIMNTPVIEDANYYKTNAITGNTIKVYVNYAYYNLTEITNYYSGYGSGWGYYQEDEGIQNNIKSINSGTEVITITNVTPFSNYSSGIGQETIYYLGFAGAWYADECYSGWGCGVSYEVQYQLSNFTSQQLSYMPSEYQNIVKEIISIMQQEYPDERIQYNNSISYVRTLQLSFNLAGTQVYYNYNDAQPMQVYDYYDSWNYGYGYSDYQYSIQSYYAGFSNYP